MPSGVIALAGVDGGSVSLLVTASDDLVKAGVHAGNLVKLAAPLVAGKGRRAARCGARRRLESGRRGGRRAARFAKPFSRERCAMPRSALALLALLGAGPAPARFAVRAAALRFGARTRPGRPRRSCFRIRYRKWGPSNIEQSHRIYRSGNAVRDETLAVDGVLLHDKVVTFSRHEDRYTVARFAPRSEAYELLFLGTANDGRHLDYVYEATPVAHAAGSWVDRLTIDGDHLSTARRSFSHLRARR